MSGVESANRSFSIHMRLSFTIDGPATLPSSFMVAVSLFRSILIRNMYWPVLRHAMVAAHGVPNLKASRAGGSSIELEEVNPSSVKLRRAAEIRSEPFMGENSPPLRIFFAPRRRPIHSETAIGSSADDRHCRTMKMRMASPAGDNGRGELK